MKFLMFLFITLFSLEGKCTELSITEEIEKYNLPEVYQDILVNGEVVHEGVRKCSDRYAAIRPVLETLPSGFKSLDIGASQGYFSFRMSEEYKARCTMVEGGYFNSDYEWNTGSFLRLLCEKNSSYLKNLSLLEQMFFSDNLRLLGELEHFDLVVAFSVIHHMKKSNQESYLSYLDTIDAILDLAPVVIIENPINTGEHTRFIRRALKERGGCVLYTSKRGTLLYEIYLFDRRNTITSESILPDLSEETFALFHGSIRNY